MKELVLDISHWDGDIDLLAWKNKRNLWGVIIKAGGFEKNLGQYRDSKFERHYREARNAGLHIGFYYYTICTTTTDARNNANHFADLIAGKEYDLPCYMDVEDPAQFLLSPRALTDVIKTFCDTLIDRGHYSGLYTGGSAWLNNMYPSELNIYANWIAWWRSKWPSEAGDIGMWQQGGIRLSDGNIVFDDSPGYHDCDWCVIDYPARIKNGLTSAQPLKANAEGKITLENFENSSEEIQNGSDTEPKVEGRACDVINAAYGELGYYAPSDPERGSKYGRWLAELTGEDWLAGPSTSIFWCCMFASWCLDQGGVKMDGFPTQNTDIALNGGARRYAVDKYDVRYGDIVIFNWDWNNTTDHIGFATGEFDGGGFTTIEGNVGNAVKEKYRQMGNVAYVLRPPYTDYSVASDNSPNVSTEPKNNRDGGKLEVDGIGGWNTIIDWQSQLAVIEDGKIDRQYSPNRKYFSAMSNVDFNNGGSKFVMAIQAKVGADVDGYWGKQTSQKVQEWLVAQGYDIGPDGIDGYFGPNSVKALQQSLNDIAWK